MLLAGLTLVVPDESFISYVNGTSRSERENIKRQKERSQAPLAFAIKDHKWDEVVRLIQNGYHIENVEPSTKRTPLHLLLFQNDENKAIELTPLLISKGVNCDKQDKYGVTPLMLATGNGLATVKAILDCGATIKRWKHGASLCGIRRKSNDC